MRIFGNADVKIPNLGYLGTLMLKYPNMRIFGNADMLKFTDLTEKSADHKLLRGTN